MSRNARALRTVLLLTVLMTGAVAGCSSHAPKRGFTVPKAMCGVSVPSDALSRLLPESGKDVQVENDPDDAGMCEVTVDGEVVLSAERERIDAGRSAWRIISYDHRIGQAKSGEGGTIAYVDRAAVSVVQCRAEGTEDEAVSTYIRVLKPGRKDESAMKSLISGYTAALTKQQPCGQEA
ncbi:hypothetical protein ABZ920_27075 [Streptomyces sp. NPDC046831]|uniref:hypothetical protein n=1 Tax=Streptomyces sp. NPDC046831 TaxID=3154805 RepID=UPI0033D73583